MVNYQLGYSISIFNNSDAIHPEKYLVYISILCPFGAIFGCLIGSKVANESGRRAAIFLMNGFCIIGNLLVNKK